MRKVLKKIMAASAALLAALLIAVPAHAAQGTITEYHQVTYGVMRVGHFEVNGQMAFCTDHDKTTPPSGTAVTSAGTVTNENMRKALYYGYGGPASIVSKNDQGWTLTSLAVSLAKGTATTHNAEMISWYNQVIQKPAPPSGFVVTLWDTGRSSLQQLATWTWNPEGTLKITKTIEAPDELLKLMEGIWSPEGTEFTVQDSSGNGKGTIRIGKDGTGSLTLPEGTYTVTETKAAPGFQKDDTPRQITVKSGATEQISLSNRPVPVLLDLLLTKKGEDGRPLEGAVFEVSWYREHFRDAVQADSYSAKRTWVFVTDEEGQIRYDAQHLKEGILFTDPDGSAVGLPGTYVLREIEAPAGYAAADPVAVDVPLDVQAKGDHVFQAPEITDELQKITIRIVKKDAVTGKTQAQGYGTFEGAVFEVLRYDAILDTDISCGTVITDESGICEMPDLLPGLYEVREVTPPAGYLALTGSVTVRAGVREKNTAVFVYENVIEETPIRVEVEKLTYTDDGTLAALPGAHLEVRTKDGKTVASFVSREEPYLLYALPAGEYLLCETKAPEGYLLPEEDLAFTVEEKEGIQRVTLINEKIPKIVTDASFDGGAKTAPAGVLTGEDRVCLEDLVPGGRYTLTAQLVKKEDGTAAGEPVTVMFTAPEVNMQIRVPFAVPQEAEGHNLVVTQTLSRGARIVAEHTDLEDTAQTVTVMRVKTNAGAEPDMEKLLPAAGDAQIRDEITYEGALAGHTYTAVMTLVDPETEEALRGADGQILSERVTFTPDEENGTVSVTMRIGEDTVRNAGRYTVYEEIWEEETLVALHCQKDAASQTLTVPRIATILQDAGIIAQENSFSRILTDTVYYSGLIPGRAYTVTGTLYDKDSGKALTDTSGREVSASAVFTPEEQEGEVMVTFWLPEAVLHEKSVVAFEKLEREGQILAVHADLRDRAQTEQMPKIIRTAAAVAGKEGTDLLIRDTVSYEGLVPERTYTLCAQLYDTAQGLLLKDDEGQILTVTLVFAPAGSSGTQDVLIRVPEETATGRTLVVFESLLEEGCEVSAHRDAGDLEQTVRIDPVPKTGDSNIVLYAALACAGSFSLAALVWTLCRKGKREKEDRTAQKETKK